MICFKKPFSIIGLMGFISATSIFAQEKKVIPPSPVISTTLYGFVRNDFFSIPDSMYL